MKKRLDNLNRQLKEAASKEQITRKQYEYFLLMIQYMQHERLIHLIVVFFTAVFMCFVAVAAIMTEILMLGVLFAGMLVLEFFYLLHYYHLENGCQEAYTYIDEINEHTAITDPEKA